LPTGLQEDLAGQVVPIVKAISMDIRGRKMLVTRKIQARDGDKGVVAHIDYFGIRVVMSFDSVLNEAQVVLYTALRSGESSIDSYAIGL